MLALCFRFNAGGCHATPWGRHVNEAAVAWPPEPWRLLRALIAVWRRKLDPAVFPEAAMATLIEQLAASWPVYRLPPAVLAHTRHFMPIPTKKPTLVFDAFARVDSGEPLIMAWPDLTLAGESEELLAALLAGLSYLGRAESWVTAERLPDWTGEINCTPVGDASLAPDQEMVAVLAPRAVADYADWRENALSAAAAKDKKRRLLEATLPARLFDALQVETRQLQEAGWSQPPAACWVSYQRPVTALRALVPVAPIADKPVPQPTTARWRLYGKPLPRLEDAVRVAERLRLALMGRAKRTLGADQIPPVLSGHGAGGNHRHAFYLAEDADQDGRIDHLLVYAGQGLESMVCRVLDELYLLRGWDGQEWRLLLEATGSAEQISQGSRLLGMSTTFESVTPYLHPWFRKKGFGPREQLQRECQLRGLPPLQALEPLSEVLVGSRRKRPVDFRRTRGERDLAQPDRIGGLWRLTFVQPVTGPLALGFGCHFGLGLFQPVDARRTVEEKLLGQDGLNLPRD